MHVCILTMIVWEWSNNRLIIVDTYMSAFIRYSMAVTVTGPTNYT
jgi:hypothetical protein